ncbi:MAG: PIN domain-containing protein [bacterium]|nr:PIN domain-containing protein [bacterium]
MSGDKPLIYWDTSIFLAWLQDEQRKPGEMDGVREYVGEVNSGNIILVTSHITKTEILESMMAPEAQESLSRLLKRRNVRSVALDGRVGDLSSKIRDHYQILRQTDGGPPLSAPDAVHLATAILYQVDEFHTFDEEDSQKGRGLIPLSGNVAGHNLLICKPIARQVGLDLRRP